ncbi:hypothetical protein QNI16_38140 [Cytophagaceae bacterium YF14B1]|uniref:Uncharacterized protein n=1 Tax=Xanthocytophaga flava TaxID=3048013 RepID=A0AAE3UD93_9BACT|nr:hypothetical protein [Xanthocytophaga flavus]MDJ1486363.1 hypothetical protein [Xanthocytophaga flavus]
MTISLMSFLWSCNSKEEKVIIKYTTFNASTVISTNCDEFEKTEKYKTKEITDKAFSDSLYEEIKNLKPITDPEFASYKPDTRAKVVFYRISTSPICMGGPVVKIDNKLFDNTSSLRELIDTKMRHD